MRLITFQGMEFVQQLFATGLSNTSEEWSGRVKSVDITPATETPIYCFARMHGFVPSMQFFVSAWGNFMGFMKFG